MAIGIRAAGTPTGTTEVVTNINPAKPAGAASGDRTLLIVHCKPETATPNIAALEALGWTLDTNVTGGAGAAGVDSGPGRTVVMYGAHDIAAPGVIAFTGSPNSACAVIHILSKAADKNWDMSARTKADDGAVNQNYIANIGAVDIDYDANDVMLAVQYCSSDGGTISAEAVAATGCTFGAITVLHDRPVSTGDDLRSRALFVPVSTGPSTSAPSHGYNNLQGASGHTAFLRIREVTPPPPGVPNNVQVSEVGETNVEVTWEAASDAPTSYETRVDGGAETDRGLVLVHDFTGLTDGTEYDFEVRAKNASGTSAWVLVTETTLSAGDPSLLPNSVERARADAATYLEIEDPVELAQMSTADLLHAYWAAKSGLSNPLQHSIMDHVIASGAHDWIEDVTFE